MRINFQEKINHHPDLYTGSIIVSSVIGCLISKMAITEWHWSFISACLLFCLLIVGGTFSMTMVTLGVKNFLNQKSDEEKIRRLKESGRFIP